MKAHSRPLLAWDPPEDEIQHCAYFLWEEMGRPEGRDLEIWFTARERLRHTIGAHDKDVLLHHAHARRGPAVTASVEGAP